MRIYWQVRLSLESSAIQDVKETARDERRMPGPFLSALIEKELSQRGAQK